MSLQYRQMFKNVITIKSDSRRQIFDKILYNYDLEQ
jgi:hypothetical protein